MRLKMKKSYIIGIVILILVAIILASIFIYNMVIEEGKKYEVAEIKQYNYLVLKENNKFGVIDRKGNTIIDASFDDLKIPNPEMAVFVCFEEENIKILNEKKDELFKEYGKVEPIRLKNIASDLVYEKTVLKYEKDGKYGLISFDGKKISDAIYESIESLSYKEGELLAKKDGKYGVINIKGNTLVKNEYDTIEVDKYYIDEQGYKNAGYIVSVKTQEGYRYGYINGNIKLKPEYNELSRITELKDNNNIYLLCAKNGQYGIIKNAKEIISNEYQSIRYDAQNSVFVVEKSKKFGISTLEGKVIVPVEYNQIDITGIYIYAENEQGTTVYTGTGTEASIDTNIAILNTDSEDYRIRINSKEATKYGVIDKYGKVVIEEKYNYINYLYENYFIVSDENRKLGIIDNKENIKLELKYDSIQRIQGTDLIQATISEGKMTEIYSKNMVKIAEMSDISIDMEKDFIKISNKSDVKYFDLDGSELKNTQIYSDNKIFASKKDEKWGYVDKDGHVVVEYVYDSATEVNEFGYAAVKKNGKWGSIDAEGNIIVEPIYEIFNESEPSFINKYYKVIYGFGEFYYTNS